MTARRAAGLALAVAVAILPSACATRVDPDAPREAKGRLLNPYGMHEECAHLAPGDRIDYSWEAKEPVSFNIHYHEGNAVVTPVIREREVSDRAMFRAVLEQDYCLMWEAAALGTTIDYRLRILRSGR